MSSRSPLANVALLAIGPALGLGIARFAYALVLPAMKVDLGWTYAMSGFINTVNAFGYLAGALLSGWMNRRFASRNVFVAGTFLTILSILGPGFVHQLALISLFRFLAGYGAAMTFISGGAIAAGMARSYAGRSGFLIGMFYAGPGFGIALSGLIVPGLVAHVGPQNWQQVWIALGISSLILGLPSLAGLAGTATSAIRLDPDTPVSHLRLVRIRAILSAYVAYGAGTIAYMTFMFAYVGQSGRGAAALSLFWFVIGAAVMSSPWIWARLMTNLGGGKAFSVLAGINAFGAILPLLSGHYLVSLASALVFGSCFLSVVASTTAFVHRNAGSHDFARMIAVFAAAFGLGQALGPILTGALTDWSGSLFVGLAVGGLLITTASLVALLQKDIAR